ncbi:DDB1- and CUL4-associated factor 11-like [Rhopilema esculentum]|uniref:DDB1- and CUL4-associated factor 11-like n=1 Tax=Rhopilema esculentum TaxID=499914 RepID=UPI0031DC6614
MGGRMSRRRSENTENEDDEESLEWSQASAADVDNPLEEDESEESEETVLNRDIGADSLAASILAFILRNSRHSRLLNAGGPFSSINIDIDSGDDSDDSHYISMGHFHRPASPQAEPCPDTSRMEDSQIYLETAVASGRLLNTDANIAKCILQRESNIFKGRKRSRTKFCPSDQVRLHDIFLPNSMQTMKKFRQKLFCGEYSTDGTVFMSACQDQHIRLYDTTNGNFKLFRDISARDISWSIVDTAYSPDQRFLIYASWSDSIYLCNIYGDYETHVPLNLRPEESRFCAFSICFSQDNTQILAGGSDQCLYVYDRGGDKRTLRVSGHEDDVNAVSFANETSDILFSGSDDGLCMVWDRRELKERDPKPVGIFAGHTDGVTYIDTKGDGRYLLSNSKDQTIKLWDMRKFSSKDSVRECKRIVSGANWDYRWESAPRRSRRLTHVNGDPSVMTYRGHSVLQTLIRAKFSPPHNTGQKYIYAGCASGNVVLYDIVSGKIASKLKGHKQCVRDISWHPYEQTIMSSSWDQVIGRWQYSRMEEDLDCDQRSSKRKRTTGLSQFVQLRV